MEKPNNVSKFFIVLDKFIQNDKRDEMHQGIEITILIFLNSNKEYDIYFGIASDNEFSRERKVCKIVLGTESEFLKSNHEKVIQQGTGVCIENVSEVELHYILFAFNMKYGVVTKNCTELSEGSSTTHCYSNEVLFPHIGIHFDNQIVRSDLLKQHAEGTWGNLFKYKIPGYSQTTYYDSIGLKKLEHNNKQSYQSYVDMLTFFISNLYLEPIKNAYKFSYKEFEQLLIAQKSFNEGLSFIESLPNESKNRVFEKADSFIKE